MQQFRNPLFQAQQQSPQEEVKKMIETRLETAEKLADASITNADGQKSMERIVNEVMQELGKAGKKEAINYLESLRGPVADRDEYKENDAAFRKKIAREMGFTIRGKGKKRVVRRKCHKCGLPKY